MTFNSNESKKRVSKILNTSNIFLMISIKILDDILIKSWLERTSYIKFILNTYI